MLKRDGEEVGHYRRVLGKFRDRYVLEIGPGLADVDRRLLVAFTVGLDALRIASRGMRGDRPSTRGA